MKFHPLNFIDQFSANGEGNVSGDERVNQDEKQGTKVSDPMDAEDPVPATLPPESLSLQEWTKIEHGPESP